ncbi:MAG: aspartyl/asparaginyl beta-hydroxylase domain-containing protein [Planctomycetota bacterium]
MFIDPSQFPIVEALESNWELIRDEFLAIPEDAFDPWIQRSMHGEGWSVFGLIAVGHPIPKQSVRCPLTLQLLQEIGSVGLAGFSRMAPGTHIASHSGWAENEYRLHLGLMVPEGCRLRVANETRSWEAGKCLIFDDTVEHEAWNDSNEPRVNLMVDFLRPGKKDFSTRVPQYVREYAEELFGLTDKRREN